MLSFIIPTRDRQTELDETLDRIGAFASNDLQQFGEAEVIVVDNASAKPVRVPRVLRNGVCVTIIELGENAGASSRNIGAVHARGAWLVMLDDDSAPLDAGFVRELAGAPADVAAMGAEILLPSGHESGGLPEVFVGCGVAIRRDAFLDCGGYDPSFGYYAEEYDLSAKLIAQGWRITHSRRFRVLHRRSPAHRDMDRIVHNLVRNNGWVTQRYTPDTFIESVERTTIERCRAIALKERAMLGFETGLDELTQTRAAQERTPLSTEQFDRFTGLAAARAHLGWALDEHDRPTIVNAGKHSAYVEHALREQGCETVSPEDATVAVIGTMSPGPMLDAAKVYTGPLPMLTPWMMPGRIAGTRTPVATSQHPIHLRAAG